VLGPRMAEVVRRHLEGLLPSCVEITLDDVRHWPLGERLVQLLCLLAFIFW